MRTQSDIVPSKSALREIFRPGIAVSRFTPSATLKDKTYPSTMTIDLHDGHNVIADIVDGTVKKSYITPMLDQNVSVTIYDDATLQASGYSLPATFYYNQDERQSVRNLTASDGDITNTYDYTAYGDKLDSLTQTTVTQRYTYTGRELNDVSGDYYFRYRMYGAGIGGFLSRDPLKYVDGMSLYVGYFAMKFGMDPYGMFWWLEPPDLVNDPNVPANSWMRYRAVMERLKNNQCGSGETREDCMSRIASETQRGMNALSGYFNGSLADHNDMVGNEQLIKEMEKARKNFITHAVVSVATLGCAELAGWAAANLVKEAAIVAKVVLIGGGQVTGAYISINGSLVKIDGANQDTIRFVQDITTKFNSANADLAAASLEAQKKCNECKCACELEDN